ncbi:hypothetical protein T484DRAFT_1792594 [Baffinella frigidus]|nr:hypothetical protein T484DRAFT_1792594 [Cryptophyta sp. CCMP2293]
MAFGTGPLQGGTGPPQDLDAATSQQTGFIVIMTVLRSTVGGIFTVMFIYSGELFPSVIRASSVAFCNTFGRTASMLAPIITTAALHLSVRTLLGSFLLTSLLNP